MSNCNMSNSIDAVSFCFANSVYERAVRTFAEAVIELDAMPVASHEFWFSDEEVELCKAYVSMRYNPKEVSDESW